MTDLTRQAQSLVAAVRRGDREAFAQLFAANYATLHSIAVSLTRHERPSPTLQPTALLHDAWLRIRGAHTLAINDLDHLRAQVWRSIHHLLAERGRLKRRTIPHRAVEPEDAWVDSPPIDGLDLHDAMDHLRARPSGERMARIVELRVYADLKFEEIALGLGVSRKTVSRDWHEACRLLRERLTVQEPAQ